MSMNGLTIWITGASSGIGEALARDAAARGATLILSSRRAEELVRVRSLCTNPERHHVIVLDLENPDHFPSLVAEAVQKAGHIDMLINNGGISQRGLAMETSPAVERRLMEIDYFGPVLLSKAVLPHMLARKQGRVVVVSSVMGYVGTPMRSTYSAAKHALHGYFDSLRAELWPSGVAVTIACPGYVRTSVSENALLPNGEKQGRTDRPKGRGISPEHCAKVILDAVTRQKEEVHVGGWETWAIRLKRHAPRLFSRIVRGMDFGQKRRAR